MRGGMLGPCIGELWWDYIHRSREVERRQMWHGWSSWMKSMEEEMWEVHDGGLGNGVVGCSGESVGVEGVLSVVEDGWIVVDYSHGALRTGGRQRS